MFLKAFPVPAQTKSFVNQTINEVRNIVHGVDDRMLCVVGPCSIHDPVAALEYGKKLKAMADEFKQDLLVIMRVYFEKPRTTVGWKGLLNDPDLDGSYNINKGMQLGRQLCINLLNEGIGTGCEWLDMVTPQYLSDVFCWGAIGARTTESQPHRQMVSALSMPVGFKNSTSGKVDVASNACISASKPHVFTGINNQGQVAIIRSKGNDACHVIHRGGSSGPNFSAECIEESRQYLEKKKLRPSIVVDCSHGNSSKDYRKQPNCSTSVAKQVASGCRTINGVMIESNIKEGNQKLDMCNPGALEYGKSITDSCVSLETTHAMLKTLAEAVRQRRNL